MNKYLYERIAPIWIASLVKLHGDKCNLHFVYSKKRKSEICAFCCVFFFSNWIRAFLSAGSSPHSFSHCSILLSGNIFLLFYSMFSCNVTFPLFLSIFSIAVCSEDIFMCYCANWIQLAYYTERWFRLSPIETIFEWGVNFIGD